MGNTDALSIMSHALTTLASLYNPLQSSGALPQRAGGGASGDRPGHRGVCHCCAGLPGRNSPRQEQGRSGTGVRGAPLRRQAGQTCLGSGPFALLGSHSQIPKHAVRCAPDALMCCGIALRVYGTAMDGGGAGGWDMVQSGTWYVRSAPLTHVGEHHTCRF